MTTAEMVMRTGHGVANMPRTKQVARRCLTKPQCINSYQLYPGLVKGCQVRPTTTRETWRWGDRSRGESRVVVITVALCAPCARAWDKNSRRSPPPPDSGRE